MPSPTDVCACCGKPLTDAEQIRVIGCVQVARSGPDVGPITTVAVGAMLTDAVALEPTLPRDIVFYTCGDECRDILAGAIACDDDRARTGAGCSELPPQVRRGRFVEDSGSVVH